MFLEPSIVLIVMKFEYEQYTIASHGKTLHLCFTFN